MAKQQELARNTESPTELALPSYAKAGQFGAGCDVALATRPMYRLKCVQGASKSDAKSIGPEGSVVCVGTSKLICKEGAALKGGGRDDSEPVSGYVIFQWFSYEKWADYNDPAGIAVLERTLDPRSPLGQRCQMRGSENKEEKYGQPVNGRDLIAKYHEVVNAAILMDSGPMKGEIAVHSWNDRGGFKAREQLGMYIARAGERGVPIYANRLDFCSSHYKRDQNEWFSLLAKNPADGRRYAEEKDLPSLKSAHEIAAKQHLSRSIVVEEDIIDAEPTASSPAESIPV